MKVVDWSINNFSHWNMDVHETQITCPGSSFTFCPQVVLYPRGHNGNGADVIVRVFSRSCKISGRISFNDHDETLIWTKEINEKVKKDCYFELIGPNFEAVASNIGKSKVLHRDRLTVRIELVSDSDKVFRLYTTIEVFDILLKIPSTIKELDDTLISMIQFPIDDSEKGPCLFIRKKKKIFSIEPLDLEKNIVLATRLSILKDNSVLRTEENDHVFRNCKKWTFLSTLPKEMWVKDVSLLLRLKIIPCSKYKHHCGYCTELKEIDIMPTSNFTFNNSVGEELVEKEPIADTSNQNDNPVAVLSQQLKSLCHNHNFSDLMLCSGGKSFPVHRGILSARSPVFNKVLTSNTSEEMSGFMDIQDLDVPTLKSLVEFLYSGSVNIVRWEDALKLYIAAVQYQVLSLKEKCVSQLSETVSISNVCDILSVGDKNQDDELTTVAHKFILKNFNEVLRSKQWKSFSNNEPNLAANTVTFFAMENLIVGEIHTRNSFSSV